MNKAFEKILDMLEDTKDIEHDDSVAEVVSTRIWNKAIHRAKQIVQEVSEEYNNGWIPCSERLPECGIKVLVQYGCGRINIEECKKNTDGIIGFYDGNYWSNADNYISWQPLPEAYNQEDI